MFRNLEQIDRYKKNGIFISTILASDTDRFETAIEHPRYDEGGIIVVEEYDDKELAEFGHKKWVQKMTSKQLPISLKDVSTCGIATLCSAVSGDKWRTKKLTKLKK